MNIERNEFKTFTNQSQWEIGICSDQLTEQTRKKKREKQKWKNRIESPIYGNHECMTRHYKTKFILTANYSFQPSQI